MYPEGLLLTTVDEDCVLAAPLALDLGSQISLQMIRALNNPPTPRRGP
jgi:hypothetical protein